MCHNNWLPEVKWANYSISGEADAVKAKKGQESRLTISQAWKIISENHFPCKKKKKKKHYSNTQLSWYVTVLD